MKGWTILRVVMATVALDSGWRSDSSSEGREMIALRTCFDFCVDQDSYPPLMHCSILPASSRNVVHYTRKNIHIIA